MNGTPARSTASSARSTSATSRLTGFSQKTALPASAARTTRSTCDSLGVQMATASTSGEWMQAFVDRQGPDLQLARRPQPPRRRTRRPPPRPEPPGYLPREDGGMHPADPTDSRNTHPDGPHVTSLPTAVRWRARVSEPSSTASAPATRDQGQARSTSRWQCASWRSWCRVRVRPPVPCASWSTGTGTTSPSSSLSAWRAPQR